MENPDGHQLTLWLKGDVLSKLDEDADRCHRARWRQIAAILTAYYEVANVELLRDMSPVRELVKPEVGGNISNGPVQEAAVTNNKPDTNHPTKDVKLSASTPRRKKEAHPNKKTGSRR
jgi:hypothetical protein